MGDKNELPRHEDCSTRGLHDTRAAGDCLLASSLAKCGEGDRGHVESDPHGSTSE